MLITKVVFVANHFAKTFAAILVFVRTFRAQFVICHELSRTIPKFVLITKEVFRAYNFTKTFLAILVFVRKFRAQFVIRQEMSQTLNKFVLITKSCVPCK